VQHGSLIGVSLVLKTQADRPVGFAATAAPLPVVLGCGVTAFGAAVFHASAILFWLLKSWKYFLPKYLRVGTGWSNV
jgi:hypothetical protein